MHFRMAAAVSLAIVAGVAGAGAQAQPKRPAEACFLSRDWQGWKASPDSRSIYLRVGISKIFRLDLSSACPELQRPNAHLITKMRGGPWICHPLDLDLLVSDGGGFAVPCIVRGISALTPEQAAALPKPLRP